MRMSEGKLKQLEELNLESIYSKVSITKVIGWILAIVIPVMIKIDDTMSDLPWDLVNFLILISSAMVMWACRLLPVSPSLLPVA